MEINKSHRECLIHKLEETNKEIDLQKSILEKRTKENSHIKEWTETELFLLERKKELIEKSLIENEFENW